MSKNLRVQCPCCGATMEVHPASGQVLSHRARDGRDRPQDLDQVSRRLVEKPKEQEELFGEAMRGEQERRSVLEDRFRKAQERAKDKDDQGKPPSIFDFD